jgi:hypothetical protein
MCKSFFLIVSAFLICFAAVADTQTGCLVQGASELYSNPIGNRDPYWSGNPNPSTPAYNGTKYKVDNRNFTDVTCGFYYIVSTTTTTCLQYNNAPAPAFVSDGGNGVIATVQLKVCNLPLDDYNESIMLFTAVIGMFFLRKNFYFANA